MHTIYITLFHLHYSKGLVFLLDVTIEDLQMAKYCEGAFKYMKPQYYKYEKYIQ